MRDPDVIRFYPEARTAHLERAAEMAQATTLYLHRRGDFDQTLADQRPDFKQVRFIGLVARLVRSPPRVLEVPEPMWFRYAPLVITLLWTLKVFGPARARGLRVVTYAIENSPIERRPRPLARFPRSIWLLAARILVALQVRHLDRVVFGTIGARSALMAAVSKRQRRRLASVSRTVEAIPAVCDCLRNGPTESDRDSVLFLGALEHRKGVDVLLRAWPMVRALVPTARLTIAGEGPMQELVSEATLADSSITYVQGAPRSRVHEMLRAAHVVVLLSQPAGRWREQVGLPIIEGVAHGCRIVTTDETGMAQWLRSQGQIVISVPTEPSVAAEALVEALQGPAGGMDYHLARIDGRLEADAWLVEGGRGPTRR
jgi:glycosyltransferase involved in cell wall biosynthesis